MIEVYNENPATSNGDLIVAFITGATEGFFSFSGVGLTGSLGRFVVGGAVIGSISAAGRSIALDESFF